MHDDHAHIRDMRRRNTALCGLPGEQVTKWASVLAWRRGACAPDAGQTTLCPDCDRAMSALARLHERGANIVDLIEITRLRPNPYQPQVRVGGYDAEHIRNLARSMRASIDARPDMRGLYQPLLVRPHPDERGCYQVGDGHHRWKATELLAQGDGSEEFPTGDDRWALVPVMIEHVSDADMLLMAVDTAINHRNLSAIDQASAFEALVRQAGMTVTAVAARYGRSRSSVSNLLRLLQLPEQVKALIAQGVLSERHGRALLPLVRVPGLLEGYAETDGDDLWTTRRDTGTPYPPVEGLFLFTAGGTEHNVARLLREHTRPLAAEAPGYRRDELTPWPPDWDPEADVRAGLLHRDDLAGGDLAPGACATCAHAVRVREGDEHRSCVFVACHATRRKLWQLRQAYRQLPAVEAWCDAHGVPRERISIAAGSLPSEWRRHGSYEAPRALTAKGFCTGKACTCLRVAYDADSRLYPDAVRPDPERAPDFVLACASPRRLAARQRALDEAGIPRGERPWTRRAHAWQRVVAARQRDALDALDIDPAALATNTALLRALCATDRELRQAAGTDDPKALWRALVAFAFSHAASRIDAGDYAALGALDDLVRALGGTPDQAGLDELHRADAAYLLAELDEAEQDEHMPGRYTAMDLENLCAAVGPHLDDGERGRAVAALRACLGRPPARWEKDPEQTRAHLRAALAALGAPDENSD